jgi:hypothetical protein
MIQQPGGMEWLLLLAIFGLFVVPIILVIYLVVYFLRKKSQ